MWLCVSEAVCLWCCLPLEPKPFPRLTVSWVQQTHNVCVTEWHKRCKSYWERQYNRRCRANPTDKYASQWSSKPEARSSNDKHIWQLDLQEIAVHRSLPIGFAMVKWCNGVGRTFPSIRLSNLCMLNIKRRYDNCVAKIIYWENCEINAVKYGNCRSTKVQCVH